MTLLERKQAEIFARASSLTREFEHWRSISELDRPFEKSNSQIRRIVAMLETMLANIPAATATLAGQRQREQNILTVHSLWDFFRSKLTLRQEEFFGEYLRACDDFAWACYEPLRNRLPVEARREPPLIFLNGGWSPYAVPRNQAFETEPATGGWSKKMGLKDVVEKLPLPMVGLPWFQVSHLPDTLVIAHEVGHIAELDFGFQSVIQQAVFAANLHPVHGEVWNGWKREVFADVYGAVCGGPSFAGSLSDFLVGEALRRPDGSSPDGDPHPHPWLRVAIVCECLRQTGAAAEAEKVAADWRPEPGVARKDDDFKDDVKPLVTAMLAGPYRVGAGQGSLQQLIPPAGSAGEIAGMIADESSITVTKGTRNLITRQIFAAARWLYEKDPAANHTEAVLKEVAKAREPGVRGSNDDDLAKQAALDKRRGSDLAVELFD